MESEGQRAVNEIRGWIVHVIVLEMTHLGLLIT